MTYQEPEFLPWDGRRVPLTFVAGYLGAGKTTLINEVLRTTDRPIAVIVNDVGEINIDARLIKRHHGDTIELQDGCVCCSAVDGFGAAFDTIRARQVPPDHVVVELSGVADPGRMIPWGKSAGFKLDGIITLVAADQITELVERAAVAEMIVAQVASADLIVLTKTDLVEPDHLDAARRTVDAHAPQTPVVVVDDPGLSTLLLRTGGRRSATPAAVPSATLFDQHETAVIPLPAPIERSEIDVVLDSLPTNVVRAKGIAAGPDGERWAIQVVGRRREIHELPAVEAEPPTDLVAISVPDA